MLAILVLVLAQVNFAVNISKKHDVLFGTFEIEYYLCYAQV